MAPAALALFLPSAPSAGQRVTEAQEWAEGENPEGEHTVHVVADANGEVHQARALESAPASTELKPRSREERRSERGARRAARRQSCSWLTTDGDFTEAVSSNVEIEDGDTKDWSKDLLRETGFIIVQKEKSLRKRRVHHERQRAREAATEGERVQHALATERERDDEWSVGALDREQEEEFFEGEIFEAPAPSAEGPRPRTQETESGSEETWTRDAAAKTKRLLSARRDRQEIGLRERKHGVKQEAGERMAEEAEKNALAAVERKQRAQESRERAIVAKETKERLLDEKRQRAQEAREEVRRAQRREAEVVNSRQKREREHAECHTEERPEEQEHERMEQQGTEKKDGVEYIDAIVFQLFTCLLKIQHLVIQIMAQMGLPRARVRDYPGDGDQKETTACFFLAPEGAGDEVRLRAKLHTLLETIVELQAVAAVTMEAPDETISLEERSKQDDDGGIREEDDEGIREEEKNRQLRAASAVQEVQDKYDGVIGQPQDLQHQLVQSVELEMGQSGSRSTGAAEQAKAEGAETKERKADLAEPDAAIKGLQALTTPTLSRRGSAPGSSTLDLCLLGKQESDRCSQTTGLLEEERLTEQEPERIEPESGEEMVEESCEREVHWRAREQAQEEVRLREELQMLSATVAELQSVADVTMTALDEAMSPHKEMQHDRNKGIGREDKKTGLLSPKLRQAQGKKYRFFLSSSVELVRQTFERRPWWELGKENDQKLDLMWVPGIGSKAGQWPRSKLESVKDAVRKVGSKQFFNRVDGLECINRKDQMYIDLRCYCEREGLDLHSMTPPTFIVSAGKASSEYNRFARICKAMDADKFRKSSGTIKMDDRRGNVIGSTSTTGTSNVWIVKPALLNNGKGIQIGNCFQRVNKHLCEQVPGTTVVVQKYIERPLLYKGRKFDIRQLVLVDNNMKIYVYKEFYVRTSTTAYDVDNMHDLFIHLTNNVVQKNKVKPERVDEDEMEQAIDLSMDELNEYLETQGYNMNCADVMKRIHDIVTKLFLAVWRKLDPLRQKNTFEIVGLDFLIDEEMKVWLIEANTSPYMGECA